MQTIKSRKIFLVIGAILGWIAVSGQFYLIIENRVASLPETIIRFFSYFTILTNILVTGYFSVLWMVPNSKTAGLFNRPVILTAITVYIFIVGIVYQLLLRGIWQPQGFQRIIDELLHSVIPFYFLVYWFLFTPVKSVQWRHIFYWLAYPAIYLAYILSRGAISGFYPYPFVEVNQLGYARVLNNSAILLFVFISVSAILTLINRIKV
ncbi:Pr6Pr family membrane protein [Flavihumibacter fluvii]|uniref:Pr6Pr family membrane protein n=1 Tax=Flavihumibacter fluvii TaxID=2838157 RepID=UPI001BDDDBAF|nr:Pr6Pr family membrane protein [Flavihumibacter fluvii]ULQ53559.1 Pr6Pr family membrane protein [Flavihumibacter fluvii]